MKITTAAAAVAAAATLALPGSALAASWTQMPSGTTEQIAAFDAAGGHYWYVTSSGKFFKDGAQVTAINIPPASVFNDLAMSPDGTKGLAVTQGGRIIRTTDGGASWGSILTTQTRPAANCSGTAGSAGPTTEALKGIAWGDNMTVYIAGPGNAGASASTVLKSTNSGALWNEVNRRADGTCAWSSKAITDIAAVSSNQVYVVARAWGRLGVSSDGFGSAAVVEPGAEFLNHVDGTARLAVSADDPSLIAATINEDDGLGLNLGISRDGGSTERAGRPANYSTTPAQFAIDAAGSSILSAGNAGSIIIAGSDDDTYSVKAPAPFTTTNWRAAVLESPTVGWVAGAGGAILRSTDVNAIPDLIAPSGSINDPGSPRVGVPASISATLVDDPGGSGIDPASIAWTATGPATVSGSGNPASMTFPAAGIYTLRVAFKDNAGNAGEATRGVIVSSATATTPPTTTPTTPKTPTSTTRTTTTTVAGGGGEVKLGVPRTCVAPGKRFTVRLTWKKLKKKNNVFVKVRRVDFYVAGKRKKIDKKAPFTQTLQVTANTRRGATVKVRARAFIKVRRGPSPTKSLTTTITTCR